jgi:urease accessory protein
MKYFVAVLFTLALATIASAHPGHVTRDTAFHAGWLHPFSGLDHILAMLAVGLLAGQRGGRATWVLPASFIASMIAGGLLALGGMPIPLVEQGVVASVFILGACLMLAKPAPYSALLVLPGLFGLFHGYAHVAEMQSGASLPAYAAGFVLATITLLGAGIAAGLGARHLAPARGGVTRFAGAAIATAGGIMLVTGSL